MEVRDVVAELAQPVGHARPGAAARHVHDDERLVAAIDPRPGDPEAFEDAEDVVNRLHRIRLAPHLDRQRGVAAHDRAGRRVVAEPGDVHAELHVVAGPARAGRAARRGLDRRAGEQRLDGLQREVGEHARRPEVRGLALLAAHAVEPVELGAAPDDGAALHDVRVLERRDGHLAPLRSGLLRREKPAGRPRRIPDREDAIVRPHRAPEHRLKGVVLQALRLAQDAEHAPAVEPAQLVDVR